MLRPEPLRVLVAGTMVGVPEQGGAVWAVLQWLLGLRRLGHAVTFVEPVAQLTPAIVSCFRSLCRDFHLTDCALLSWDGRTEGMDLEHLRSAARDADVLLNISGVLRDPAFLEPVPTRVWVDLDPAFNQLWHAVEGVDMGFDGHTHFATVGLGIGSPICRIPDCGRRWIPTLPPVVLDEWPFAAAVTTDALTTVANWRGYGSIAYDGVTHGQKAHSTRALIDLPSRLRLPVGLALSIHADESKDLDALKAHGWTLIDPVAAVRTPAAYRSFVQGSRAELGIAKSGYVASRCGWFSDRSACYLASGRPVVAQDTGFSHHLPTGHGLFGFDDAEGAAIAVDELISNYDRHRRAARELACEYLESGRVLGRLLECLSEQPSATVDANRSTRV